MPKGLKGEKRSADVVGGAVRVAEVATGEIKERPVKKSGRVRSGRPGAKARAKSLTKDDRREIAKKAAAARWRYSMSELSAPPWATPLVGFRSRKAAQLCTYFAMKSKGTIEKLKLIKLLYFAERKFLFENHHPMLFDEYYSLPHGPICSSALNGIDGIIHEEIWDNYITRNGNIVVAIKSLSRDEMDEVSDAELSAVDEIWKEFGHMTPSQLRNYSHQNCPEYTETKGRIAISYKQILRAVGVENPDVVANDIEEMIDLDITLSD